jgi:transcriptional regulator with XRE-family HTH domain
MPTPEEWPGTAGQAPEQGQERQAGSRPRPPGPDPGDLSRRVAARRAQLRLTIEQVAARAQMSPGYVEYLERYPASISAAALRALAAALETSPSALLGAGLGAPPGHDSRVGRRPVTRLSRTECFQLIAPGGIGRIAFPAGSWIMLLPVSFAVIAGTIVFRTSAVGVIAECADDCPASFEVDRIDEAWEQGWSVLIQGTARRVTDAAQVCSLRQGAAVSPWAGGDRDAYMRVIPARISGRRVMYSAS